MNLTDRVREFFGGQKRIGPGEVIDGVFPVRGPPPKRGSAELIASYKTAPWLRAVTDRIAYPVACNGWRAYVKTSSAAPGARAVLAPELRDAPPHVRRDLLEYERRKGTLREIPDHPILDLLAKPNAAMTGRSLKHVSQVHLDVKGEAFLAVGRNGAGMPNELWSIPPHWVQDTPGAAFHAFRVTLPGGKQIEIPERDMIWIRQVDPSNPYGRGTGVAESLGDEIETDHFASAHLKTWFYNRAIPELLVGIEGANPAQVKEAHQRFMDKTRGISNAYGAFFHNGKMNAMRLDSSFRDQQMIELRKQQRDFVIQVFGVPPETLGIIENSNRATIDAAFAMLAEGVIAPRLELWRSELQAWLVPQFDERLILEYENPVPADKTAQLEAMKAAPWAPSMNEWRAKQGLPPKDGGDEIHMAIPGASTLDEAAQAKSEDPQPAKAPAKKEVDSEVDPEEAARIARRLPQDPPWAQ